MNLTKLFKMNTFLSVTEFCDEDKFHLHMDVSLLAINWKRGVTVVALVNRF